MTGEALRVLLRLDLLRLRGSVRSPALGPVAGQAIPVGLAAGLLWAVGRAAHPSVASTADAVLLAMLVAGPISYLAYGTFFRSPDTPLLRRLGLVARAIYLERAARHLLQALGVSVLAMIPFIAAGAPLGRPVLAGLAGAIGAWSAGSACTAGAALVMARHRPGEGWGCLMAGIRDHEVAAAAPLAYAPLPGFLTGIAAGAAVGIDVRWLLIVAPAALLVAAAGAGWYERALPRFGPQALEMAFSAAGDPRGGDFRIGRGLARLLPRAARAVQARDAVVAARRFPWAARAAWPVTIGGAIALARWGEDPATRAWVGGGVVLVLLAQAIAGAGLGRAEAAGSRWFDRSVGIGPASRFLGRWAWGWGLSLWMTIPIALTWTWWSGVDDGWTWVLAGGFVAGIGAVASTLASGWR